MELEESSSLSLSKNTLAGKVYRFGRWTKRRQSLQMRLKSQEWAQRIAPWVVRVRMLTRKQSFSWSTQSDAPEYRKFSRTRSTTNRFQCTEPSCQMFSLIVKPAYVPNRRSLPRVRMSTHDGWESQGDWFAHCRWAQMGPVLLALIAVFQYWSQCLVITMANAA